MSRSLDTLKKRARLARTLAKHGINYAIDSPSKKKAKKKSGKRRKKSNGAAKPKKARKKTSKRDKFIRKTMHAGQSQAQAEALWKTIHGKK